MVESRVESRGCRSELARDGRAWQPGWLLRFCGLFGLFLLAPFANGSGLGQLHAFLEGAKSGEAEFTQMVTAKSGRKPPQMASGSFAFARPGKFRWAYQQPYPQLLVSDGAKLWIWDKDLNQVTVKKLGQALGESPAALLAGDNALEKHFDLKEAGEANGLEWVEATPKAAEGGFSRVRIGLKEGLPQLMEIHDNFGHTTNLIFDRFRKNTPADAANFRFTPPKGADVVGE